MLYSEHLRDKLDAVMEHWELEKDFASDVITIYLRVRKLSLAYADGLDKQLKLLSSARHEVGSSAPVACLRDFTVVLAKTHRHFADVLLTEIASPLQTTLTRQTVAMKEMVMQGKKHSKKIQSLRRKLAKDSRHSLTELEEQPIDSKTNLSFMYRQRASTGPSSLQKYLDDNASSMKEIIDTLQMHEIDRLRVEHMTLNKFSQLVMTQGSDLAEIGLLLQEVGPRQKVQSFNVENALHEFIYQNIRPSQELSAQPAPREAVDPELQSLCAIMQQCWDGKHLSKEDWSTVKSSFAKAKGRAGCLNWLNKQRANGAYEFIGVEPTGDILNMLLDEAHKDCDVVSASMCIVLSQTFHDSAHQFLQERIMRHSIWLDFDFWDAAFKFKVTEDMQQFNQLCVFGQENESELKDKMNSVLLSQISTFITIMKSFELREEAVAEFVERQCKEYAVSPTEQEVLMSVVSSLA
jgi:hypothetical protein